MQHRSQGIALGTRAYAMRARHTRAGTEAGELRCTTSKVKANARACKDRVQARTSKDRTVATARSYQTFVEGGTAEDRVPVSCPPSAPRRATGGLTTQESKQLSIPLTHKKPRWLMKLDVTRGQLFIRPFRSLKAMGEPEEEKCDRLAALNVFFFTKQVCNAP